MDKTMKRQATIYREDPRYIENGKSGTRLTTNDAYLDIEDIALDKIFEPAQFEITATETKDEHGNFLLPILDRDDLYFSFLQAYGFFFSVIEASWEDSKKSKLKLILKFDPDENFSRPLTARYLGKGTFELDRDFPHKMPQPVAYRHDKEPRIIRLLQESETSRKLKLEVAADEKYLETGEKVEILSNWRPDLVGYGSKK